MSKYCQHTNILHDPNSRYLCLDCGRYTDEGSPDCPHEQWAIISVERPTCTECGKELDMDDFLKMLNESIGKKAEHTGSTPT